MSSKIKLTATNVVIAEKAQLLAAYLQKQISKQI